MESKLSIRTKPEDSAQRQRGQSSYDGENIPQFEADNKPCDVSLGKVGKDEGISHLRKRRKEEKERRLQSGGAANPSPSSPPNAQTGGKPESRLSGSQTATPSSGNNNNPSTTEVKPVAAPEAGKELTPEENAANGLKAMNRVISEHVDVPDAMHRAEVGSISFVWGKPGTETKGYHDGGGVSHIIAARNHEGENGEVEARKAVEVLAYGKISDPYGPAEGQRVNATHDGHTAVLSLYRYGEKETWLLTGWDDNKRASGAQGESNNPQGYTPQSSGSRTEAGEASSEKDNTSSTTEVKPPEPPPTTATKNFGAYNDRRYSRPWGQRSR